MVAPSLWWQFLEWGVGRLTVSPWENENLVLTLVPPQPLSPSLHFWGIWDQEETFPQS